MSSSSEMASSDENQLLGPVTFDGGIMGFDEGAAALDALISETERGSETPPRNEAETRFHIIDTVLTQVLQWPRDWIHVEQKTDSGYTDYELGEAGTVLIIEAKREGTIFSLPSSTTKGIHRIPPLLRDSSNKELNEAMTQVMTYCSSRGVAPAIVTNGQQWVAFLASRTDSTAPLKGKALVFPSLAALRDDFLTFWRHFSTEGVASRRIYGTLSVTRSTPPPPLSALIHNYPGVKKRNAMQANLQVLGELVLEDFPTNPAYAELFLTECYATSGALSNYAEVSRELLSTRYNAVAESSGVSSEPVQKRKGINEDLAKDAAIAALSRRPIVLLGSVGAGKSTFIQRLIHVDAKEVFDNALTLMVNYGQEGVIDNPTDFTIKEIERQLRDDHAIDIQEKKFIEDLYRTDLNRFDSGIFGSLKTTQPGTFELKRIEFLEDFLKDRSDHMARAFERISRSRRKQVIVFLDNVDQRSREDQNAVFLISNELAAKWHATVFVTLRPETYYESERYGAASGYHPRIFTIAPPRTDTMLQKRIDFGLKILDAKESGPANQVGLSSDNLEYFLKMLGDNFRFNQQLIQMIENVSGGNMRRALGFVTQFIGSGHLDTEKIITIQKFGSSGYTIPQHEFLRSLLHGDSIYYDPKESPLPNLFRVSQPLAAEHFIVPLLLDFLDRHVQVKNMNGYMDRQAISAYLQSLGYTLDGIASALQYCARHRLIEGPQMDASLDQSEQCRPTTVGIYSMKRLPGLFAYVDPVIVDTPVLDQAVALKIGDEFTLDGRLNRTTAFREYLDNCWEESNLHSAGWCWPSVSQALHEDVERIRRMSRKNK
ncbi:hypothetical protein [Paenarthrobacter sp. AB444]|uniref:hypothetical protein n=1 Tax=Paenarthrobacter sp. AB444 TaxID=3025681 RepID=UPI0023650BD5|nr:hypothetical protein [Paenarthrobacter sp. AB444]MDD7833833.1 hypothetical protein [Paenarthrobacter sp. AB444]